MSSFPKIVPTLLVKCVCGCSTCSKNTHTHWSCSKELQGCSCCNCEFSHTAEPSDIPEYTVIHTWRRRQSLSTETQQPKTQEAHRNNTGVPINARNHIVGIRGSSYFCWTVLITVETLQQQPQATAPPYSLCADALYSTTVNQWRQVGLI